MSSFHGNSSDNQSQSACSMHSEPQPTTWRAEAVVQTDSQSQAQRAHNQLLDNKNEELDNMPDVTDLFKKNPNSSNKYNSSKEDSKDQLVAPPKLSFAAFLSPIKSEFSTAKPTTSIHDVKITEKLSAPKLSLSFPLLSQEETANVQPLSPLSGSSISTIHPYQP